MSSYAKNTKISATNTMNEIQGLLAKYGYTKFGIDLEENAVYFQVDNKSVKISVPKPQIESFRFTETKRRRTDEQTKSAYDQDLKSRWRLIKEKLKIDLELIRLNIKNEKEIFMSSFVMKSGKTLAEEWIPKLNNGNTADLLKLPDKSD